MAVMAMNTHRLAVSPFLQNNNILALSVKISQAECIPEKYRIAGEIVQDSN
jgi:hypothetical protein